MTFSDDEERQQREREYALRLRALEAELDQPPLQPSRQQRSARSSLHRWGRQLKGVATFLAIAVAVAVALRVAAWLARIVIVAAIAWVVYKMFFEDDR